MAVRRFIARPYGRNQDNRGHSMTAILDAVRTVERKSSPRPHLFFAIWMFRRCGRFKLVGECLPAIVPVGPTRFPVRTGELFARLLEASIPINVAPMSDDTNNDLPGLGIDKIKHSIVSHSNAMTIAIFEFFTSVRKRLAFKSQNRFCNAFLHVSRQSGKFLSCVTVDFNQPTHTLIFNSFNTWRNGWCG